MPDSGIPADEWVATLKREGQSFLAAAAREWEADVIVIGTHGRSGVSRLMLASTAESVVRHASCPVLVIKPHT